MRLRLTPLALIAALLTAPSPARPHTSVEAFVAFLDRSVRELHTSAGKDEGKIGAGCGKLIAEIFDLERTVRSVLASHWAKMTPPQRDGFVQAFTRKLAADCIKTMRGYAGQRITLLGVRPAESGEQLVATRFATANDPGRIVTWRMRGAQGKWLAVDLIADGRSTVITARNEFPALLQSHGGDIDAVIATMTR